MFSDEGKRGSLFTRRQSKVSSKIVRERLQIGNCEVSCIIVYILKITTLHRFWESKKIMLDTNFAQTHLRTIFTYAHGCCRLMIGMFIASSWPWRMDQGSLRSSERRQGSKRNGRRYYLRWKRWKDAQGANSFPYIPWRLRSMWWSIFKTILNILALTGILLFAPAIA